MQLWPVAMLLQQLPGAAPFELPPFSWDVVPRFVHCGPDFKPVVPGKPPRLALSEIYKRMSTFPLATLEKFTLQTEGPPNVHEEAKILQAAKAIKSHNTSTKVPSATRAALVLPVCPRKFACARARACTIPSRPA